jgi:hypothetical protein
MKWNREHRLEYVHTNEILGIIHQLYDGWLACSAEQEKVFKRRWQAKNYIEKQAKKYKRQLDYDIFNIINIIIADYKNTRSKCISYKLLFCPIEYEWLLQTYIYSKRFYKKVHSKLNTKLTFSMFFNLDEIEINY